MQRNKKLPEEKGKFYTPPPRETQLLIFVAQQPSLTQKRISRLMMRLATSEFRKKDKVHSPITSAIIQGDMKTLQILIQKYADIFSIECDGLPPLHIAASFGQVEVVKYLFDCGLDVNVQNEFGSTPLYEAAVQGHDPVVYLLLNLGANVHVSDIHGRTSVYVACYFGRLKTVTLLHSFGANINQYDRKGISPVGVAAGRGFLEIVKFLFTNGANLAHTDNDGLVPVCIAALQGHVAVVRFMCLQRIDFIHVYDNHGRTPIYAAAQRGHISVIQELYHHGADLTIPDDIGRTPISIAAFYNQIETVQFLTQFPECNINQCDKHNRTPLHSAASKGHHQVIEILCRSGAIVHARDHHGRTPLFIASEFGHHQCVELLCRFGSVVDELDDNGCTPLCFAALSGSIHMLSVLIACGANVNLKCAHDRTPIYCAASGGKPESITLLFENHADLSIPDSKGRTPLYIAAIQGRLDCVKLLCSYGCSVNSRTELGCTPLYAAALEGKDDIIKELKEYGASLDTPDYKGRTPLHMAIIKGHNSTAKLLCKLGANMNCKDRNNFQPICIAAESNAPDLVAFFIRNGVSPSTLMNYHSNTFSVLEIQSKINAFCLYYGLDTIESALSHPDSQYVYYNAIQMIASRLRISSDIVYPILTQMMVEKKLNIRNFSSFHSRTRGALVGSVDEIRDQIQQNDFTNTFQSPYSKCLLFLELMNLFSSVEMMNDVLSLRQAVLPSGHSEFHTLNSFPINRWFPIKVGQQTWKYIDLTLIERYLGGDTSCYVSTHFLASFLIWLTSVPRGDLLQHSSPPLPSQTIFS